MLAEKAADIVRGREPLPTAKGVPVFKTPMDRQK